MPSLQQALFTKQPARPRALERIRIEWNRMRTIPFSLAHVPVGRALSALDQAASRLALGHALARTLMMLTPVSCALALSDCSAANVHPEVYAVSAAEPVLRHTNVSAHRRHALLAPQAPPDCEYKGSDADAVDTDLWQRLKLDYQQHCYQHAEALVRSRLHQLQVSGLCEVQAVRHRRRLSRFAPSF